MLRLALRNSARRPLLRTLRHLQSQPRALSTYAVPGGLQETANVTEATYREQYARSVANSEEYWGAEATKRLTWSTPFESVKNVDLEGDVKVEWFGGGKLNVSANCIDRHLETRGEQTAIIWESDCGQKEERITYKDLHARGERMRSACPALSIGLPPGTFHQK